MSGPLLIVLHLIPQGVLAGLFFVMGVQALEGNGITNKILYLCKDRKLTPASDPLKRIRRRAVCAFVAIQLLGFGATFAITQTIAAVGFPVVIFALIPLRILVLPKWFSVEELAILDGPTASPFTMVNVGGNYGEEAETGSGDGEGDREGSGGVMIGDEGAAERGEGSVKRRGSVRGERIELQNHGMSRRSTSRQSK